METSQIKSTPKDVFFHLLAIATLYITAVSFGTLLFGYVDNFFPDRLANYYGDVSGSIRWAVASIIIVFPVYFRLSWSIQREATLNPEKRGLKIRRWLFAFTLFLAAIVIIGDLVTLIYNFLGGDLTVRFVLKIIAVLFIAGAIFGYYLWVMKREGMASRDPTMRFFVWAVVLIVAIATIGGFFLVGSPFRERLRRFDERRVSDLQSIQSQTIYYWQRKAKLPGSLADLRDPISGFVAPVDPETGTSYEYRTTAGLAFELCATFKTDSSEVSPGRTVPIAAPYPASMKGGVADSWQHGPGRVCFERTIDPDLYRIQPPVVK